MKIKKAYEPLHELLLGLEAETTVADLLASEQYANIVAHHTGRHKADKSDNWLTVDGKDVARKCAMLGAWYIHDNTDKEASHFYRNGSYHIGVEKLKNAHAKEFARSQAERLAALEDDMLEGNITPREWREQKNRITAEAAVFNMTKKQKAELIKISGGVSDKPESIDELPFYSEVKEAVEEWCEAQ